MSKFRGESLNKRLSLFSRPKQNDGRGPNAADYILASDMEEKEKKEVLDKYLKYKGGSYYD